MRSCTAGGLKSWFVYEDHGSQYEWGSHPSSVNSLADTLKQVELQIRFLTGLIYRLANEPMAAEDNSIKILRHPREIADYIYRNKADCVMFSSPDYMPIVLKHKELGWVKDPDEFADWLMVNWTSNTLVIAVP